MGYDETQAKEAPKMKEENTRADGEEKTLANPKPNELFGSRSA